MERLHSTLCKHSGSQVEQIGHFVSSIKTGKTANDVTCSKKPFLILSKSWKGGQKKTKTWEAGKGREQTTVCSILLPNSLDSQQAERGFSRDKEISGEELSFCPLRNQSIWTKILWEPLYYCLCFSWVRDWLYEGVHKSICLTQLLNSSTDENKPGTEIPTQGVTLMHSDNVIPGYGTTNTWFHLEKIPEAVLA